MSRARCTVCVPALRCPRCARVPNAAWQAGYGFLHCRRCGEKWWAMVLAPGAVRPQMERTFGEAATLLIDEYGLPTVLDEPMFWQIPVSKHEAYHHARSRPLQFLHAIGLLRVAS